MSNHLSVAPVETSWSAEEQRTEVQPTRTHDHEESGVWRVPGEMLRPKSRPAKKRSKSAGSASYDAYSPLVRRIAMRTIRSLPRTILLDDILSAGWVGMSEALGRRPEDMPEDQFEAYASYRIRGAILDYLRALDPLSRRLRGLSREMHARTRELGHELGRAPTQEELAERMKLSLPELQRAAADIHEAGLDRFDPAVADAPSGDISPEDQAERSNAVERVKQMIERLPERLQVVLSLHYEHECNLREIGVILGVTESRVCQLHAEAVARIRRELGSVSH
jgi:RNA polymerase sigma factor FliA